MRMNTSEKKILIIEDDKEVRETIAEIVENAGYKSIPVQDGQQAIHFLDLEIPDLVISDIMMPNINGYQVLNHIKEMSFNPIVPFIFISARAEYADIREGMINGADDYITKPFRAKELIQAVETQLDKKEKFENKFEQICSNISTYIPHELITPIVAILGYPDMIMENFQSLSENEIGKMLSQIKVAGLRLNKTVNKFVRYTDIQSRLIMQSQEGGTKSSISHTKVAINLVCQKIFAESEREKDIIVNVDDAMVKIEHEDLEYIVEELLTNALKFSRIGSQILIKGKVEQNVYRLEIHDNGRGMSKEQIRKILPFDQHERAIYQQQGIGLGLITVKKIIDFYKGKFHVTSEPDKSTTCVIILPINN
jgi:two-component system, sensor histidine kinase and response regulator